MRVEPIGNGHSTADYCAKLKAIKNDKSLDHLGTSTADRQKALDAFKSVEDLAPRSIKAQWTDLREALQAVMDAKGNAQKLKAMSGKVKNARSDTTKITAEVKKDCKLDLNAS